MNKHFSFVVYLVIFVVAAYAQTTTATLTGSVTDTSGATVPGAVVTVTNAGTGIARRIPTSDAGYYTAALLPPGTYQIRIEKEGFRAVARTGITLNVDQVARLDFVLEVGTVSEAIDVTSAAPLLEASTSSLGQVIDSKQFTDLPLNNRTALGLLSLSDNVSLGRNFSPDTFNNANQFSANGSRPGQNEILLDGAPNTTPGVWPGRGILGTPVVVDSIQEFKVQTSVFSAEYGRTGGGLINMVSKSGSNDWHGSLFEFHRNSKMDANNFFANRGGVALGSFKRNQFGGTLGGPVILPKLYSGRNRTFFFANYQATRDRSAANTVRTVPTAEMRGGDFSRLTNARDQLITIYDPLTTVTTGTPTRQPFAGNRIPGARINPVAAKASAFFPNPNQAGAVNNLVLSGTDATTHDIFGVRVDHALTQRQNMYVRYNRTRDDSRSPDYYGNVARGYIGLDQDVHSVAVDHVYTLRPTFLLNLRYGFTDRTHDNIELSRGFDLTSLGFPNYVQQEAKLRVFPRFNAAGYTVLGNNEGINAFSYLTHSFQANATKISSRHTVKFGADLRLSKVPQDRAIDASGTYNFSRGFTQGPNALTGGATAGDGYASMLLGVPSDGAFGTLISSSSSSPYYGIYVQDDWKVTQRLTLNLGMRYELEVPRQEAKDRLDWFDYNVVSPLSGKVAGLGEIRGGLQFAGVGSNPRRHFATDGNNFAPRFGFAYQVTSTTVVRGGYGVFFGSGSVGAGGWNIASLGFAPSTDLVGSLDGLRPTTFLDNPFPNGFAQAVGNSQGLSSFLGQDITRLFDRGAPLPYNQQWNFSIQRQFGAMLVQTAYSGSRGIHLGDGAGFQINQLPASALELGNALQQLVANPFFGVITNPGSLRAAQVARGQLLRPYPQFGNLTVFNPAASASTYHGFSVKAERRFAAGLGFLASYTTSKNISDSPATIGPAAGHQDAYNRRADRSLTEEDIAQRFTSSVNWELPIGRGRLLGAGWGRAMDTVAGGWQINALMSMQTGPPLVITNTPNTSRALGGTQRPNSTGISSAMDGPVQSRLNGYLNTAAFSAPAVYTYGNVSRTLPDVRGPRASNIDLSIFKIFPLREKLRLQFRAEMFNATNTPVFGLPNGGFGGATFGVISSQSNRPRQVQLALRMYW
ncbi:MAG: TonB-dependent receptor [Acidobacteria bacterium]|nr:TonB-dependent receptor [Acidobacteriota bacterium]